MAQKIVFFSNRGYIPPSQVSGLRVHLGGSILDTPPCPFYYMSEPHYQVPVTSAVVLSKIMCRSGNPLF